MRVAICTGKTGGHVYPALAVALYLRKKDASHDSFFIGTCGGLDHTLLEREGFRFRSISGCGLPTRVNIETLRCGFKLLMSFFQVYRMFRVEKPDVVLAFGGYISCAPVLIAHYMKIPVVVHEANIQLGRANRFLSRWADRICTTFPDVLPVAGYQLPVTTQENKTRIKLTGLPIREKFFTLDRTQALRYFGFEPGKIILLVMGGSLGSKKINDCWMETLNKLRKNLEKKLEIIHITGQKNYNDVREHIRSNGFSYRAYPFLADVENAFRCADLFVGRAGASTIAEITYCGLPSILIPYPHAIEDHQSANAQYLSHHGAASIIAEDQLTSEVLANEINRLLENDTARKLMSEQSRKLSIADGAARIVNILEEVLA